MKTREITYNTERKKLVIPEYGRHIHKMVEYAITIEDKEKRNKVCKSIIGIMGNMSPHLRDVDDFQHKLWDQLLIISDFKLEVESPYELITRDFFDKRPDPISYPKSNLKYKFYGKNIMSLVEKIKDFEDVEPKKKFILFLTNHMKKTYLTWNRNSVEDTVIFNHLKELSQTDIEEDLLPKQLISSDKVLGTLNRYNSPQRRPKSNTAKRGQ